MNRIDLLEKIKRIELKLNSKSSNLNQGDYKTSFKGQGMIFSEVRNYHFGDDVRNIDWNVTARFKETFVKVFEEEKDKNLILLIDVSSSGQIGYDGNFKIESILEVAATVMLSAHKQNLPIGALIFTDKAECYFPPKKGKSHILEIINSLIEFKKRNKKTSLVEPLNWFRSKKN